MIAIQDIAYVRVRAPDLDLMQRFLLDFGMEVTARTNDRLYMHGTGSDPVVHVTERGDAAQLGFALKVGSRADLEAVAARLGSPIMVRDEPGGGEVVKTSDPDGNQIELVHGIGLRDANLSRGVFAFNGAIDRKRYNDIVRNEVRPSHVMRLGHVALHVTKFAEMNSFYRELLGMKVSDSYFAGHSENTIAAFLHCGLGKTFVDHHTIALIGDGRTGFEHFAFEVLDFDDLMMGNKHLLSKQRWVHSWGVGRHNDGSQIFDYWRDPFGNKIEHWTDGDLVNDDYQSTHSEFTPEKAPERLAQWGPPLSPDFMR